MGEISESRATPPRVHILTWCGDEAALYGTLLTFKTLRTGFPNSPVLVVDNASVPAARAQIREAAHRCGAQFVQLDRPIAHAAFIQSALMSQEQGQAVFLDPDLCFWGAVEHWRFPKALVAGRLLPKFRCEYTRTITHARLHTSFLWVPDVAKLRNAVVEERARGHFEWDPITPSMFRLDGEWHRLDTGAGLYSVLGDRCHAFNEAELNAYDHLFVGSHLSLVAPTLAHEDARLFVDLHHRVRSGDHESIRGAWRLQDDFFRRRACVGSSEQKGSEHRG